MPKSSKNYVPVVSSLAGVTALIILLLIFTGGPGPIAGMILVSPLAIASVYIWFRKFGGRGRRLRFPRKWEVPTVIAGTLTTMLLAWIFGEKFAQWIFDQLHSNPVFTVILIVAGGALLRKMNKEQGPLNHKLGVPSSAVALLWVLYMSHQNVYEFFFMNAPKEQLFLNHSTTVFWPLAVLLVVLTWFISINQAFEKRWSRIIMVVASVLMVFFVIGKPLAKITGADWYLELEETIDRRVAGLPDPEPEPEPILASAKKGYTINWFPAYDEIRLEPGARFSYTLQTGVEVRFDSPKGDPGVYVYVNADEPMLCKRHCGFDLNDTVGGDQLNFRGASEGSTIIWYKPRLQY